MWSSKKTAGVPVLRLPHRTGYPLDFVPFHAQAPPSGEVAWINDPQLNPQRRLGGTGSRDSRHPAGEAEGFDGEIIWRTSLSLVAVQYEAPPPDPMNGNGRRLNIDRGELEGGRNLFSYLALDIPIQHWH